MRTISALLAAAAALVVQAGSWSVQIPNIGSAGVAISFTSPATGFLPINDVCISGNVAETTCRRSIVIDRWRLSITFPRRMVSEQLF